MTVALVPLGRVIGASTVGPAAGPARAVASVSTFETSLPPICVDRVADDDSRSFYQAADQALSTRSHDSRNPRRDAQQLADVSVRDVS